VQQIDPGVRKAAGRAAEGSAGTGRDEDGGEESERVRERKRAGGTPHRRRFVNRPLATLQCGRKVRERERERDFHWPARSRPCALNAKELLQLQTRRGRE